MPLDGNVTHYIDYYDCSYLFILLLYFVVLFCCLFICCCSVVIRCLFCNVVAIYTVFVL